MVLVRMLPWYCVTSTFYLTHHNLCDNFPTVFIAVLFCVGFHLRCFPSSFSSITLSQSAHRLIQYMCLMIYKEIISPFPKLKRIRASTRGRSYQSLIHIEYTRGESTFSVAMSSAPTIGNSRSVFSPTFLRIECFRSTWILLSFRK